MTYARVIADSVHDGNRVTTLELRFHRFILAEFNTHRVFSRSAESTRAVPVTTRLEQLKEDPAFPLSWPAEQPGMQGGSELEGNDLKDAEQLVYSLYQSVFDKLKKYVESHPDKSTRLHKSVLGRYLEPFAFTSVVVTATEWGNFFDLRAHVDAQPEFRHLAYLMRDALENSEPVELDYGSWHIPYLTRNQVSELGQAAALKVSAARCARVSYNNHRNIKELEADFSLFESLASSGHWSPMEHQATPDDNAPGNLWGWGQYRHIVERTQKSETNEF